MPTYKVTMQFPFDTTLPRDVIAINPHFNTADTTALMNALKANLDSYAPTAGKPYTLKIYDALKAKPNYPIITLTNPGTAPATGIPRELCICLSYYTTRNVPRQRGRLYLPASWYTGTPGLRPTSTNITAAMGFVPGVLTKQLPPNSSWQQWSVTDRVGGAVTDYWVDDEWDIQRKRGLKPTTRQTGKV
jgi:hypothetical protein